MSWKKVNEAIEVVIDYLKRAAIILGIIILILFLFGCEEDGRTNQKKCQDNVSEYMSLGACDDAMDCRLSDREYWRYRNAKILSLKYCQLSMFDQGGETDTDVQPPAALEEEELSAGT